MKTLAMFLLLLIGGICLAEEKVTVYLIDRATENREYWEHSIKNQMLLSEPDASALAKALAEAGKEPPAILDTFDFLCGVQIESKVYVLTVLYQRGIEVQQATLADGKIRLKGESRVLGELPVITKLLQSYVYKMLDQDAERKKKQEAEQADAEQPATRSESKLESGEKPQPESEGRSR
jgi:hypothetical protein